MFIIEPSAIPQIVRMEPKSSTTLNITVAIPNEYSMNGLITQIGISYRPLSVDSNNVLNFSQQIHSVQHSLFFDGRLNYTVTLTGLFYFSQYELYLNYSTVVGFGHASDIMINRTAEHGEKLRFSLTAIV